MPTSPAPCRRSIDDRRRAPAVRLPAPPFGPAIAPRCGDVPNLLRLAIALCSFKYPHPDPPGSRRTRLDAPRRRPTPMTPLARVIALPVHAYRLVFSPWVGRSCRFDPTCSAYALEALRRHGAMRGTWLTLRRISRCRPGGGWGVDDVPE